jgi:thiosulfate/3-mercaptopyruvate sulfurtransferase
MKRNSLVQFGIVALMLTGIFLAQIPTAMAIENGGYPNERFLVSTQWLAAHLNDPNIRILDRQDIFPKDNFYAVGHIPNSIRMPTSAIKGMKDGIREMLVEKDLLAFLDKNGVSDKHHIILVGRVDREPANTRVFWTLEMLGHKEISVLDGGIDKWRAEGRPLTKEAPKVTPGTYKVAGLQRQLYITGEEIKNYLGIFDRLNFMVVDSRDPDEFKGVEMSRDSQKLGRIPGAMNLVFTEVLTGPKEFKEFKPAAEIKKIFEAKGLTPDKHLVFTCVSGCFGTTLYFAARLLDYKNVSIYDGGWIEWSQKNYPVEVDGKTSTTTPTPSPANGKSTTPSVASPPLAAPAPTPAPVPGGKKRSRDEGC